LCAHPANSSFVVVSSPPDQEKSVFGAAPRPWTVYFFYLFWTSFPKDKFVGKPPRPWRSSAFFELYYIRSVPKIDIGGLLV